MLRRRRRGTRSTDPGGDLARFTTLPRRTSSCRTCRAHQAAIGAAGRGRLELEVRPEAVRRAAAAAGPAAGAAAGPRSSGPSSAWCRRRWRAVDALLGCRSPIVEGPTPAITRTPIARAATDAGHHRCSTSRCRLVTALFGCRGLQPVGGQLTRRPEALPTALDWRRWSGRGGGWKLLRRTAVPRKSPSSSVRCVSLPGRLAACPRPGCSRSPAAPAPPLAPAQARPRWPRSGRDPTAGVPMGRARRWLPPGASRGSA